MNALNSYRQGNLDWELNDLLNLSSTNGKDLFSWLTENVAAVASTDLQPTICLYYDTNTSSDNRSKEARKLLQELESGTISKCTRRLSGSGYHKLPRLSLQLQYQNIAAIFSMVERYEQLGLEGGLYLSNGLFIPQDNKENSILILVNKDDPFTNMLEGEIARSLYRAAIYLSEALNLFEPSSCRVGTVNLSCDSKDNGSIYLLALLLENFSENCQVCTEGDRYIMKRAAARNYSFIKGSYKGYSKISKIYEEIPDKIIKGYLDRSKLLMVN